MSLLIVVLAVGVTTGCAADPGGDTGPRSDQVGAKMLPAPRRPHAPDLVGTTLSGATFDLSDHVARAVTLVNVWASWCGPCRREMPILVRAASGAGQPRLSVVGIDERDTISSARSFSSSLGATYPSLIDTDGHLLRQLPGLPQDAVPSTLFIDAHGRIAALVVGPIGAPELHSILSRLRAEA